ncbi:MAG: hypothetical protein M3246_09755 [Actinomycetota bacterium]|nr:hypothetical protein [Actinomycetota bacterium]
MSELSEREQYVQHMLEFCWEPDEIEAKLLDDDLWVLEPAMRQGHRLQGEAGVHQWEEAAKFMEGVAHWAIHIDSSIHNHAMWQLIVDAAERAEEALDRARQRVQEGGGG